MRAARLTALLGALAASGALHLKHLAVDGATLAAMAGGRVPTIWQEMGRGARAATALAAAGVIAVCFRPARGAGDRVGGAVGAVLGAAVLAGAVLARQAAATDAAVVRKALGPGAAASAGWGFWLLVAGAGVAAAGLVWDSVAAWRSQEAGGADGQGSGQEDGAAFE